MFLTGLTEAKQNILGIHQDKMRPFGANNGFTGRPIEEILSAGPGFVNWEWEMSPFVPTNEIGTGNSIS